jgi:hypothetical protein
MACARLHRQHVFAARAGVHDDAGAGGAAAWGRGAGGRQGAAAVAAGRPGPAVNGRAHRAGSPTYYIYLGISKRNVPLTSLTKKKHAALPPTWCKHVAPCSVPVVFAFTDSQVLDISDFTCFMQGYLNQDPRTSVQLDRALATAGAQRCHGCPAAAAHPPLLTAWKLCHCISVHGCAVYAQVCQAALPLRPRLSPPSSYPFPRWSMFDC